MAIKHTSFGLILFLFCEASLGQENKNKEPISIIINDWSSQIVLAHITGSILNSAGYNTKYAFSTINEQWGALSQGIDHVQVEVWEGSMADKYYQLKTPEDLFPLPVNATSG